MILSHLFDGLDPTALLFGIVQVAYGHAIGWTGTSAGHLFPFLLHPLNFIPSTSLLLFAPFDLSTQSRKPLFLHLPFPLF